MVSTCKAAGFVTPVALSLACLIAGCGPERSAGPPVPSTSSVVGCNGGQKPAGSQEGEVYGSIYEGGQRTCANWTVTLSPAADAQGRLHMPSFNPNLTASPTWSNMFEFWDPLGGAICAGPGGTIAGYVANGSAATEAPHAPAPNPNKEGHCVRPGTYHFSGAGREFDVEYIQPSGIHVTHAGVSPFEIVEVTAYDPNVINWQDLVINTDITTVHPGDTPILEIENVQGSPYATTFSAQTNPSGTAADWFRFSVGKSTSNWAVDARGSALARLWYDGNDQSKASPFYDYKPEGYPVLRLHKFPNPTTATRQYVVGLELMRPDESPAEAPSVTQVVTITRINPDLAGSISAPGSGIPNQGLTVTVQESNLGASPVAPVEAGWTGKLYLSTDQVLSPATDVLVDTYTEATAIAAQQTVPRQRTFTVPGNLSPGTYYVIASLDANGSVIESNESNNTAVSAAVSISTPPVACATFEGLTTWQNTDQLLNAGCSTAGANIQYRWQTDTGGPWTSYSPSTTYEFRGHATTGAHTVTLQVLNTTTQASATHAYTINVQAGQVTITGQSNITVKASYTYTASQSSTWYERLQPATAWGTGLGPQTTYTRVWSIGCYVVDLRADASGGGVLKRGRKTVTVSSGTGCGGPL